jgi:hypothetical protein
MTTVRILFDGIGEYRAGDIVPDAPEGLVEIAERGITNAANDALLAEIIEDVEDEFTTLKTKAKELKIAGFANMKYQTLKTKVETALAELEKNTDGTGDSNGLQQPNS